MSSDYSTPPRKRVSRARERREKRRQRQEAHEHAVVQAPEAPSITERIPKSIPVRQINLQPLQRGLTYFRDTVWHLVNRSPFLKLVPLVVVGILGVVWLASLFTGQIPPNVWALGVPLGGNTLEGAQASLQEAWDTTEIEIHLDNDVFARVKPSDIGMTLDATQMVEEAKDQGLAGIPFGVAVEPIINIDAGVTQAYLLGQVDAVYVPPYDAGFAWDNDRLISVDGAPSRELDVTGTLELLRFDPLAVYQSGKLDLQLSSTPPAAIDGSAYVDTAYRLITRGLILNGYDPFIDEYKQWGTSQEFLTQLIAVGPAGLAVREDRFRDLITLVNNELNTGDQPRYLRIDEAREAVQMAFANTENEADVRIRYLPHEYIIEAGDTGHSIGRQHGLPFLLIEQANPDIDMNILSIGDVVTIPSRDAMLPEEPIVNKRIVVDLERRWLVGFENGEIVFDWQISIGLPSDPTIPGIFQVLSHVRNATGSSSYLCGANGVCGQWTMEYFMGIYEVAENLTNGFHGVVHLPSGGLLGDGSIGARNTYGCVMSASGNSEFLFNWADEGTVVEIISYEFEPESEIGRIAKEYIEQITQST
ncbi:MAG: L,D-transpeptidase family protein [Anaerolineaceae bacterium]|nr:L,D-transpeptidase family protein [Anaerolineaceae bacterium]